MIYVVRQWAHGRDVDGIRWHLERHGLPFEVLEAYAYPRYPALQPGDAVIGLGGPPSMVRLGEQDFDTRDDFVAHYAGFMAYALIANHPTLFICMSHQLRARLARNEVKEHVEVFGINPVTLTDEGRAHWLFEGLPEEISVFEHHRDQVVSLDHVGILLAGSPNCPIEAVAWKDVGASVQFHPEGLQENLVELLSQNPEALANTGLTLEEMMARLHSDYTRCTSRMFDNFLYRAGAIARPR